MLSWVQKNNNKKNKKISFLMEYNLFSWREWDPFSCMHAEYKATATIHFLSNSQQESKKVYFSQGQTIPQQRFQHVSCKYYPTAGKVSVLPGGQKIHEMAPVSTNNLKHIFDISNCSYLQWCSIELDQNIYLSICVLVSNPLNSAPSLHSWYCCRLCFCILQTLLFSHFTPSLSVFT